jgi:hypothetical protein
MLVSPTGLPSTTDPVDEPIPEPPSAAPLAEAEVSSTEVLISTQTVLFSTAAAVGVPRETIGGRRHYPKRYEFLEDALAAREMDRS